MKKILLFTLLLKCTFGLFAQNVDNQKVNFQYIQLPEKPLKGVNSYQLIVNIDAVDINNQDSLAAYNVQLAIWESNYQSWLTQKMAIDKSYLQAMEKYDRSINAGNTTIEQPTKKPYPVQPLKEDIPYPILTENVDVNSVQTKVALDGFSEGNNGAVVTVEILSFQNANVKVEKKGEASTTKYEYTSEAKYPIHVTIADQNGSIIVDQIIGDQLVTEKFATYDNQYSIKIWELEQKEDYWTKRQLAILNSNLTAVNTLINNKCGYTLRNRSTEIYTVKKHKGHSYNDLVDAYTLVNSGYGLVKNDRNHASAKSKILKGIEIWEKALGESNVNDNKSRINKKVTALIFYNLAEAYLWIDQFDNSENYRIKAEQAGVLKYKSAAKRLESLLKSQKSRYQANY